MRTYVITLVIPEGNDEFWEATAKLGHKKAVYVKGKPRAE